MKTNKWSFYEDGLASWTYHFPIDRFKKHSLLLNDVFKAFLEIGKESCLIQLSLQQDNVADIEFFIERFKSWQNINKYVNFSENGIFLQGETDDLGHYFFNKHFFYNEHGEVEAFDISSFSKEDVFKKINYPVPFRSPQPLLDFCTGINTDTSGEIIEGYIRLTLNSDIWLNSVPCMHCEHWDVHNEEIDAVIREEGLSAVVRYWSDNSELAQLNRDVLNSFMSKMNAFAQNVGGSIELDNGGLSFYEGKLTPDGIFE